jgi:cyanophycin synthetase
VVVKPSDGNHARGVFTNLIAREEVESAYAAAVVEGSGVIVERYVRGSEHRLLVIGGKLAAAARGETARVIGDGRSTIDELIDSQINSDPRRGAARNSRSTSSRSPTTRLPGSRFRGRGLRRIRSRRRVVRC